ncbi:hypothetical protein IFR04_000941 [Cadophora malorum]|uniref:Uncharacterized protein n=1 Tax=Cadophora malorum TaxID=108018 RepID=A0A8H7WJM0_9HELO|nr:hypothetical protein IFR04_000941 [Cadophora malorum]
MAKLKNSKPPNIGNPSHQPTTQRRTLFEIRKKDTEIWYKLKVLLYDLLNIKNDPASVARLERTVNEMYMSEPYFMPEEAEMIKGSSVPVDNDLGENDNENDENERNEETFELREEVAVVIDKAQTDFQTAKQATVQRLMQRQKR